MPALPNILKKCVEIASRQISAGKRHAVAPVFWRATDMAMQSAEGRFGQFPVCRQLPAEYGEERGTRRIHFEAIVACHACCFECRVIHERTHTGVAPNDVVRADRLASARG